MASTSPRSVLKSPHSPGRKFLSVSFQDPARSTSDSTISSKTLGTPISASWSLRSSPSLKTDESDRSSVDGLSIEEITCLDVDDLIPKTDYTYARTASYSPKYLRKKRYISPNMSRRRINGPESSFLSDDDDEDYEKNFDNDIIVTRSENTYFKNAPDRADHEMNSERQSRPRKRSKLLTSSPVEPHGDYHISTHDHYYDGMLLRSGSHVKGSRRALRDRSSNTSNSTYVSKSPILTPTYRSELEANDESHQRGQKTITTVTTTTTETSFDEDEDDEYEREIYIDKTGDAYVSGKSKKSLQFDSEAYQKTHEFDDSEMKLHLDERETEKVKGRGHIRLRHLDGLDYDEDISDIDDAGGAYGYKHNLAYQEKSTFSRISSFFIMIITTITTTITESTQQVLSPVAVTALSTVTYPVRGVWRAIMSTCSWILWNSSSVLLWDIEAKQRRRRGCCCCLLPFLLLLPFALLAGYFSEPLKKQAGGYLSASELMISSYWAHMWTKPSPIFVPPPIQKSNSDVVNYQVDMTQLDQHIHQTILQVMGQQQKEQPQGLTVEQVEAIVKAILASQLDVTQKKFEGDVANVNDLMKEDMSALRLRLAGLEKEISDSDERFKILVGNLNGAKDSLGSMSEKQRTEWLAVAAALEEKLLEMRNELNEMTNQNLVMAALVKSCCKNDTVIMEAVHMHLANFFSQVDKDSDSAAVVGLMSLFGDRFVDKDELDEKVSAVAAEITEKMRIALVKQAEKFQAMQTEKEELSRDRVVAMSSGNVDELVVKGIVEDALLKYSADGIGMPDFALESAGGSVLNIRCSETFYRKTALVSVFGLPLWYTSNSPRTVIQPSVHPGECWAFQGSYGFIVIQLAQPVQPTGFSLEHIPKSLAPSGNIDSAPRTFSVYGLTADNDLKGVNLGNYTYLDTGRPIQHFPVQNQQPGVFPFVELRVLSNYGNVEYTCLYRFRVHGLP